MRRLTWLAFVVSVISAGTAVGATLSVDCAGGGDYLTIQEAVDAAANLDTILIAPCVYNERVEIIDKVLRLEGSGADITELRWDGPLETLYVETPSGGHEYEGTIVGMTITREPPDLPAVVWKEGWLELKDCIVEEGTVTAIGAIVSIRAYGCDLRRVAMHGSGRYSRIVDSRVGSAYFSGWFLYSGAYEPHALTSERSEYGSLSLSLAYSSLTDDTVESLSLGGTGSCHAVDSWFGDVSSQCGLLRLDGCTVSGPIDVWGETNLNIHQCGTLRFEDCLLHGPVQVDAFFGGEYFGWSYLHLVNNTFLSDLLCSHQSSGHWMLETHVINNIVMGDTVIDSDSVHEWFMTAIVHNDFVGGATIPTHIDSLFGNFSADPLFCPGGDYTLQACSPCAGTGLDGRDIGAFGVGCDCSTVVENVTWGRIKSIFR